MKRRLCMALALILFVTAAACGTAAPDPAPTLAPWMPAPEPSAAAPREPPPDVLRVVIFDTVLAGSGRSTAIDTDMVNGWVWELGFNLQFELFRGNRANTMYDDYQAYVVTLIHENAMFTPISALAAYADLLGDRVSIGYRNEPWPHALAVLVREDIDTPRIETADDYIALLKELKHKDPLKVPGLAVGGEELIYPLFLPQWGYWSPRHEEVYWAQGLDTGMAHPLYTLPESQLALGEFAHLMRERLLAVVNTYGPPNERHPPNHANYPTLLLPLYAFMDYRTDYPVNINLDKFDASGYRIYPLYSGLLPDWALPGEYAMEQVVGSIDTDPSELLRFLSWLEDEDNYNLFFYGVNSWLEQQYELDWQVVRDTLRLLQRNRFKRIPATAPSNYLEALDDYAFTKRIAPTLEDMEPFYTWWRFEGSNVYEVNRLYSSIMSTLYMSVGRSFDYDYIVQTLNHWLYEPMQQHEATLDRYAELMQMVLSNVESNR